MNTTHNSLNHSIKKMLKIYTSFKVGISKLSSLDSSLGGALAWLSHRMVGLEFESRKDCLFSDKKFELTA